MEYLVNARPSSHEFVIRFSSSDWSIMRRTDLEALSGSFRLDYLGYLRPSGAQGRDGQLVISAEFKASKRAIEAEILVTGFVEEPEHESPFQHHLLPLLNFTIPLVPRRPDVDRFSAIASNLQSLAEEAAEVLDRLDFPLYELALQSKKAGGLKEIRLKLADSSSEQKGPKDNDIRRIRQDRKFEIARAHVKAHLANRELPLEGEEIRVGRQTTFTTNEVKFANLYTLARAIGVKEIAPRILGDEVDEFEFQKQVDPKTEFTVLVARLRRAKVIPE